MFLYLSMEFDCGVQRRVDAQAHCFAGADPLPRRSPAATPGQLHHAPSVLRRPNCVGHKRRAQVMPSDAVYQVVLPPPIRLLHPPGGDAKKA
jgi:hypothetical protein